MALRNPKGKESPGFCVAIQFHKGFFHVKRKKEVLVIKIMLYHRKNHHQLDRKCSLVCSIFYFNTIHWMTSYSEDGIMPLDQVRVNGIYSILRPSQCVIMIVSVY